MLLIAALFFGLPLYAGSTGSTATVDEISWPSNQALLDPFGLSASEYSVVSSLLTLEGYGSLFGGASPPVLFSGSLTQTPGYHPAIAWSSSLTYQAPSAASSSFAIEAALFNNLANTLVSIPGPPAQNFVQSLESQILYATSTGHFGADSEIAPLSTSGAASSTLKTTGTRSPPSPVPEPATLGLLGCVIVALSLMLANRSVQMPDESPDTSAGSSWHKNT